MSSSLKENILSSTREKSTQEQWMMHCENVKRKTELAFHHSNATMAANFAAPQHNTDEDLDPPTFAGLIFNTKTHCLWAYLREEGDF